MAPSRAGVADPGVPGGAGEAFAAPVPVARRNTLLMTRSTRSITDMAEPLLVDATLPSAEPYRGGSGRLRRGRGALGAIVEPSR
jgi:hypothetical protein